MKKAILVIFIISLFIFSCEQQTMPTTSGSQTANNALLKSMAEEDYTLIEIDIKPGSDDNTINYKNNKKIITVAILSTQEFDATNVNHETVRFGKTGIEASEIHVNKKTNELRRHEEDVDNDGDIDLVFHFRLGDTGLEWWNTKGILTGETSVAVLGKLSEASDIILIKGIDSITSASSTGPGVKVLAPDGGESLIAGETFNIEWVSTNISENVKIDLYSNGEFVETIISSTENDGLYEWSLILDLLDGTEYVIRLTDNQNDNIFDESDSHFAIVTPSFGTQFLKTYSINEENFAQCVVETNDGNYLMTINDMMVGGVILIDNNGIQLEEKQIVTGSGCGLTQIIKTSDGGYLIVGRINGDVFLYKMNESLAMEWSREYDYSFYDWGASVVEIPPSIDPNGGGGYVTVGFTIDENYNQVLYILKIDLDGNIDEESWDTNPIIGDEFISKIGTSIKLTDDGNIIIGGLASDDFHTSLFKLSPEGIKLWDIPVRVVNGGRPTVVSKNGNYYIAADYTTNITLTRVNAAGDPPHIDALYDIGYTAETRCVNLTTNEGEEGFIVTGNNSDNYSNSFLLKTDADGIEEWRKYLHLGENGLSAQWVIQTTDGGYAICGYTQGYPSKAFLWKTDANGNTDCGEFGDCQE